MFSGDVCNVYDLDEEGEMIWIIAGILYYTALLFVVYFIGYNRGVKDADN